MARVKEHVEKLAEKTGSAITESQRIRQLEDENAKLKGEKPIPFAWWSECPKLAQRTMERIIAENARLKRFAEKIRDDEVEYYISACDGDTTWKAVARMWADQALKGGD